VRTPLSVENKLVILTKQEEKCSLCRSSIDMKIAHFDHVIAFKLVGDEVEFNFQALCSTCNLEKGTNHFYQLKAFLIRPKRNSLTINSNL
jgi:hypothetical protein